MSDIKVLAEHSVDVSLLKRDSKVLDLGMRYAGWSIAMLEHVDRVCAVDADSSIVCMIPQINFLNAAVGPTAAIQSFIKFGNGTGNFLHENEPLPRQCTVEDVHVFTLDDISDYFGVEWWDVLKIDIEGSEFEILHDLQKPIATQLTFELHMHTHKRKSQRYVDEIFNNLSQWYDFPVIDLSEKHGCGMNYWDVLCILKNNL